MKNETSASNSDMLSRGDSPLPVCSNDLILLARGQADCFESNKIVHEHINRDAEWSRKSALLQIR